MPDFKRLADIARAFKLTKQTGRAFHVTFILRGAKLLSVGFNNFNKSNRICATYKSDKPHQQVDYRACTHSECSATAAIKYRDYDAKRLTVVNVRIDNNNRLANSKPCPNCAFLLGKLGYTNIFYSDSDGKFQRFP